MNGKQVALCVDEQTRLHPEVVGLEGENLDAQNWLELHLSGEEARASIGGNRVIAEAWVASCDDVEPINLAATLKSDRPDLHVRLITAEGGGSLYSRAHTARIDEVLENAAFLHRYLQVKRDALDGATAQETAGGLALPDVMVSDRAAARPPVARTPVHMRLPQEKPSPLVARSSRRGFVLPIVSGSGGAGKSTVAVAVASAARRRGFRTLLLDYDLQFGDLAVLAGVEDPLEIDVALAHPDQLERELSRDESFTVLAAPARLESAEAVVRDMPGFLDGLSARFDVIIANTGAAWAEQHAVLLERSSAALFLIDQRMSSVRACRHALELCARCGIASGPFQFALNRCAKGAPLTSIDVSCALQGVPVFEIKDGGREVEECLSSGAVGELMGMNNEFIDSIEHLVDRMLPRNGRATSPDTAPDGERKTTRRRGRHAGRRRNRGAL